MYTTAGRIGYSECDDNWRLTPQGLIDRFQDCSTLQSEDLSMGERFVREHHATWILASWDIHITRLPAHAERVETATWPYGYQGLFGFRNYTMKDENGELLACADSHWFYFDFDRERPVKVPEEVVKGYEKGFGKKLDREFAPRKIVLPEGYTEAPSFVVTKRDIDSNRHVNNSVYLGMAMDYLPPSKDLQEIRIEYLKAAVLSDTIVPKVHREEGLSVVRLDSKDGKTFAVIEARER